MAKVYVNGTLRSEEEAQISTFDHGIVVGDGAFETVLLYRGRPFVLARHLARLNRSLDGLSIRGADLESISTAVHDVIQSCDYEDGRIRITVTAGNGPLGSGRYEGEPSVVVACAPVTDHHEHSQVQTVPWPRNERGALAGLKTISYAENAVALAYAAKRDADEAIFGNLAGNLCEGSGSNIFVVIDGELTTPPLSAGCLAGITRELVLELHGATQRDLHFENFHPDKVDEAFLTSAIRGVQPIATVDGRSLDCVGGPITEAVAKVYYAMRNESS
jgi:branched-chain amino acid aminotransferase